MTDPLLQLRSATRRAKSDVANKIVSMFLHELSRDLSKSWPVRLESNTYIENVRATFGYECPYCNRDLRETAAVVEHLDGMNRYRVGLHVAGNVLVACRSCNNEKRRDDSAKVLTLADTGWESFLSHNGSCQSSCRTCHYWAAHWAEPGERIKNLSLNKSRLQTFRAGYPEFSKMRSGVARDLSALVGALYGDCQKFAEDEINSLLKRYSTL